MQYYIGIPVLLFCFIIFIVMVVRHQRQKNELSKRMLVPPVITDAFESVDSVAGFGYDKDQDIFYSTHDAWQRKFGYCQLYDEVAAASNMIVHCEPFRFAYEGKRWLIEIWKGQYGITTGCEVGVYTSDGADLNIPKIFDGTFYGQTLPEDNLQMELALLKDQEFLFCRNDRHWWLTGFVLASYSQPSELTMQVKITLKTKEMRDIFIRTVKDAGYLDNEMDVNGNSVALIFKTPHAPQPITQSGLLASIVQAQNKLLCRFTRYATRDMNNTLEKMAYLQKKLPWVSRLTKLTGSKKMHRNYEKFKGH